MKKQLPAILLGIVCLALLFAYTNANDTIQELRSEVAQLKGLSGDTDASTAEPATESVLNESGDPLAAIAENELTAADEQDSGRLMMENVAKMMDNPTMNEVMQASQRGAISALYVDMIDYLGLNEEETEYFMDLLMYRHMKQVDMAMKMMGGQLSDEEKESMGQDVEAAKEIFGEEMKKFLNNNEDYAEFEYYEKTMNERMMLSQMDRELSGSDAELSDTAYRELLGAIHDERENFEFTSDLHDNENPDVSAERFSKENVQSYASDMESLNEIISEKARGILTPEQYEAFIKSLKAFTDMQLAQLEMAAQMFGGGE
jgi:hypothetical protein